MSNKQKNDMLQIKRFGYVLSALFIVISNISLINNWSFTPVLFLITMYFLTGALWAPSLIKPFYQLFGKNLKKNSSSEDKSESSKDLFSKN